MSDEDRFRVEDGGGVRGAAMNCSQNSDKTALQFFKEHAYVLTRRDLRAEDRMVVPSTPLLASLHLLLKQINLDR